MSERVLSPHLRLVWSKPKTAVSAPIRLVNLAWAIERHLAGQDGMTDQQFLVLHATGRPPLFVTPTPRRF
jgi:hypothetical protein